MSESTASASELDMLSWAVSDVGEFLKSSCYTASPSRTGTVSVHFLWAGLIQRKGCELSVHSSFIASWLCRIQMRATALELVFRLKPRVTDHFLTYDQLSWITLGDFSLLLPSKHRCENLVELVNLLFCSFRLMNTSQWGLQGALQLAWSTSGNMKVCACLCHRGRVRLFHS